MLGDLKKKKGEKPVNKIEQCSYCGNRGHGKYAPLDTRKKLCPATKSARYAGK